MTAEFDSLLAALQGPRRRLLEHALYQRMSGLDDLRVFQENHVFAVWDFMSLLKSLQRLLTCCEVPWIPKRGAIAARFVNEIVLGEESDEIEPGRYLSHFELYLAAMRETGASTVAVDTFLGHLSAGVALDQALVLARAPESAAAFVRSTLAVATRGAPHQVASAFCLGREDVIPDMFRGLVNRLGERFPGRCTLFQDYLARHIQVDGDRHGPMSRKLLEELCGNDLIRWRDAGSAALGALEARVALWDGIAAALPAVSSELVAIGE